MIKDISVQSQRIVKKRAITDNYYPLKGTPKGRPGQILKRSKYHWPLRKKIIVTEYAAPGLPPLDNSV